MTRTAMAPLLLRREGGLSSFTGSVQPVKLSEPNLDEFGDSPVRFGMAVDVGDQHPVLVGHRREQGVTSPNVRLSVC
jgi:hypothetical protein